jgi:hypothetical protein
MRTRMAWTSPKSINGLGQDSGAGSYPALTFSYDDSHIVSYNKQK